jgi:Leucine-rich repeat (LRR) protein
MDSESRRIYLYWLLLRWRRTYAPRSLTILRLPDAVGRLTSLRTLDLRNCCELTYLPDSLGRLSRLRELLLNYCWALTYLPESLGQLTALQKFECTDCRSLKKLPESFGNLTELLEINLTRCSALSHLPDSLEQLVVLRKLNVGCCWFVKQLPESLVQCRALENLNLSYSGITKLPEDLGQLVELRVLDIKNCHLSCLPDSLCQLKKIQKIDLHNCKTVSLPDHFDLAILPRHSRRGNTFRLDMHLPELQRMPEFDRPVLSDNLCYLVITAMITSLPESIGSLSALVNLRLTECPKLSCLPNSIGMLPQLKVFEINSCHPISLPETFASLTLSSFVVERTWLLMEQRKIATEPTFEYVIDGRVLVPGHVEAIVENTYYDQCKTLFCYYPAETALVKSLINFYLRLLTLIVATRRYKTHPRLPNELCEFIFATARDCHDN